MSPSKISFSAHAEQQLRERELSRRVVLQTLRCPDAVVEGYAGCRIAQRVVRQGGADWLLRVVYAEEDGRWTVVTVYRTSKWAKYLKR